MRLFVLLRLLARQIIYIILLFFVSVNERLYKFQVSF